MQVAVLTLIRIAAFGVLIFAGVYILKIKNETDDHLNYNHY